MLLKGRLIEVVNYIIFGILTTVINILVFGMVNNILGLQYFVANVLAWIISVIFAFVTNKYFVFRSKDFKLKIWIKEGVVFFGARLVTGILDMGLMIILISFLNLNELVSKVIVNVIIIISNYFLSKLWVFR